MGARKIHGPALILIIRFKAEGMAVGMFFLRLGGRYSGCILVRPTVYLVESLS